MSPVAILEHGVPKQRWLHILLPIMILCIVSYVDRTNISFAIPRDEQRPRNDSIVCGFCCGDFLHRIPVPAGAGWPDRFTRRR